MSAEPTHSVGERSAELEAVRAELAQARARLLALEQELADLPGLKLRSERLEEIESSPLLGPLTRSRDRAELRAGRAARGGRRDLKRLLARLVAWVSPPPDDRDE